jgi:hypothetical protein
MNNDAKARWVGWVFIGWILIILAFLLFLRALLDDDPVEPLFIFGVLLLLPVGVYLVAEGRQTAIPRDELLNIRRDGPGTFGSDERKRWIEAQIQRARSIRTTVLAVIFGSLALYLSTHVDGTIRLDDAEEVQKDDAQGITQNAKANDAGTQSAGAQGAGTQGTGIQGTGTQGAGTQGTGTQGAGIQDQGLKEEECQGAQEEENKKLRWRTHAERLNTTDAPTPKDATLAQIALKNGLTVAELAMANPAAQLEIREDLQSVVTEGRKLRKLDFMKQEAATGAAPAAPPGAAPIAPPGAAPVAPPGGAPTAPAGGAPAAPPGAAPPGQSANQPEKPTDKPVVTTLESAARQLGITSEQVAVEFPVAVLVAGQQLRIPVRTSADPLQWYDWFLWALIGLAASLLIEIGRHTRLIFEGEGDFLGETPWYWAQLTTGPLIAFAILLMFTHIDLDLLTGDEAAAAVEVNLHRYPIDLLIVPAFLLGFYSRVAREILDQLMRAIFRSAWRAVYGGSEFKIAIRDRNGDDEIDSDSKVVFETRPQTPVVWSASAGTINAAGVFEPPPFNGNPMEVFITAIPTAETNGVVARKFIVVKKRFEIVPPKDRIIVPGQKAKLRINTSLPDEEKGNVTWRVVDNPAYTIGGPGVEVELDVPADRPVDESVKVEATYAGLSKTVELKVGAAAAPVPGGGPAPAGGNQPGPATPPVTGSKPALTIRAALDAKPSDSGAQVPPGSKLSLEATGLTEEQAKAIDWTATPVGSLTFDPAKGAKTTATVGSQVGKVEIVAKHADASPGSFSLEVKAG